MLRFYAIKLFLLLYLKIQMYNKNNIVTKKLQSKDTTAAEFGIITIRVLVDILVHLNQPVGSINRIICATSGHVYILW